MFVKNEKKNYKQAKPNQIRKGSWSDVLDGGCLLSEVIRLFWKYWGIQIENYLKNDQEIITIG